MFTDSAECVHAPVISFVMKVFVLFVKHLLCGGELDR
jgi:hypothetical protein